MKRFWMMLVIVVSLILSGCAQEKSGAAVVHMGVVDKVVDGDTIRLKEPILGTKKVRLLSIDAPETNFQGQGQQPWGKEATDYLASLIPRGTKIQIETDSEQKDRYNRLLAHLKKGTMHINHEMVNQGYAVTYFIYPNQKYFQDFQQAYVQAKLAGRGMWDKEHPISELPFEFRDRISGQAQDKFVGNFYTKKYVLPEHYKRIVIEKRLFFFREEDAIKAGYSKLESHNINQ